jgi:hypothetical protein
MPAHNFQFKGKEASGPKMTRRTKRGVATPNIVILTPAKTSVMMPSDKKRGVATPTVRTPTLVKNNGKGSLCLTYDRAPAESVAMLTQDSAENRDVVRHKTEKLMQNVQRDKNFRSQTNLI